MTAHDLDLNETLVFVRVAQAGSFTRAARGLGMPKSTVSRKVSELEQRLGARLLQRTTRKLSLTDVGRLYFAHGERAVAELEAGDSAVSQLQETPRGLLRVTAPLNFTYLGPIICSFARRHPDVQLELVCSDRLVDLVEEGFDVAVRAGHLTDSTLVARQLGTLRRLVVASPAYVKKHGAPKTPRALVDHSCLVFGGGRDKNRWRLESGDKQIDVVVPARITLNDFDMLHDATLSGLGIAMLPTNQCNAELRQKRFVRLLPSWASPPTPIQAVYPSSRFISPKLKAFLDHLRDGVSPPPWDA